MFFAKKNNLVPVPSPTARVRRREGVDFNSLGLEPRPDSDVCFRAPSLTNCLRSHNIQVHLQHFSLKLMFNPAFPIVTVACMHY